MYVCMYAVTYLIACSTSDQRVAGSTPASGYYGLTLGTLVYLSLPNASDGTYILGFVVEEPLYLLFIVKSIIRLKIKITLCMYVSLYVCIYSCMNACMYVFVYVCIYSWL